MPSLAPWKVGSFRVVSFDLRSLSGLSEAERSVVGMALSGLDNRGIAERRQSSARTVANQLAVAYRKLGVSSRAELLARLMK